MKKIYLSIICTLGMITANAQSYIGFLTDNYKGVHGVINNPASIVGSKYKVDINLAGASASVGNDYYGLNIFDSLKGDFDFDDEAEKFPESNNNLFSNIDILGPSFMLNLNKKSSLAVFTRARVFFNVNDINGAIIDEIDDGLDDDLNFNINEGQTSASTNAWGEVGVTYARILMEKDKHFLKGGISLKYLLGFGNAYTSINDLSIDFDAEESQVTTAGDINYGYSENFEDDIDADGLEVIENGFGVDLGFVYEWAPHANKYTYKDKDGNTYYYNDVNRYKLKLGLSVTDLGVIDYDGEQENYNVNGIISKADFEDIEDANDIEANYGIQTTNEAEKSILPTALHFNVDWNINQKFYLNLNTDLSLTDKDEVNANHIANMVSLTPRFESKWFTFQIPASIQQYSGFQLGAGLRVGPLYIGSGSIVSAVFVDDSKAADVYAGLKIPIYQSRPKDTDNDGSLDKVDNCPNEAGPIENAGCPWGDSDNDTVLDNVDNCPNEAGPVENQGCPWADHDNDGITDNIDKCPEEKGTAENDGCPIKDTDGDSIIDKEDNCPNEAGPVQNQGCPWADSDGDSITDNVDECPTTPGTIANNGCPEVTAEVQKALNSYAKTILFDSGKSSIKAESNQVLTEIVTILNDYSNAKFTIEGHTDSAGSNTLNQNLSDSRANAIKVFLIENGIDQSRLSAIGYGEDKPITSNSTREGRAQNRRVEINLVK